MKGQWIDYDSFDLIEIIEELKTRREYPHRADDVLHGIIISLDESCNYTNLRDKIIDYLKEDDKR